MRQRTRQQSSGRLLALAVLLSAPLSGCSIFQQLESRERENIELRDRLAARNEELTARQERIDGLEQQVNGLQDRGELEVTKLPHASGIRFARLTGGHDYDGAPGDDGITVYLQPVDADGHVIKAAGSITIDLFDLANPDGTQRIVTRRLNVDQTRKAWSDGLWTRHYTIDCPWPEERLPAHREITVRATFTDYLTGKAWTTQQVVTITYPPSPSPVSSR